MDVVTLLLDAATGAVTGFLIGATSRRKPLGLVGHTLLGALAGVAGGWSLPALAPLPAAQAWPLGTLVHVAIGSLFGGSAVVLARGVMRVHRKVRPRPLPPPHPSSQR